MAWGGVGGEGGESRQRGPLRCRVVLTRIISHGVAMPESEPACELYLSLHKTNFTTKTTCGLELECVFLSAVVIQGQERYASGLVLVSVSVSCLHRLDWQERRP
jgi:hypothetical protein